MEAYNAQVMADKEYWAIVNKKAAEIFIEGSIHDTLMSSF